MLGKKKKEKESMNLVEEISKLPNFYYEYDGKDARTHMVILGGISCKKSDSIEAWQNCGMYFECIKTIFAKEELTERDEKELANSMHKIQVLCEARLNGIYSLNEQTYYINKLQKGEVEQLENQVVMYKAARQYYRKHLR